MLLRREFMRYKEKIIIALLILMLFDIFLIREARLMREERVVFCDVGQGDAALISLAGGVQAVIDGGPSTAVLSCLGKYMPYFDRRIEYLIVSHPDKDHFIGLVEILKRYAVNGVIINGETGDSPEYEEFLRLAAGKIIPAEDFEIGGAKFDFLKKEKLKEQNDNSLVFKFSYAPVPILPLAKGETERGISILFTGDISEKVEAALPPQYLKSDILKISHHGSRESSSEKFLKAVRPTLAAISVGADNKYGHPAYIILKRLENLGIKYLRTDEAGDIIIKLPMTNYQ